MGVMLVPRSGYVVLLLCAACLAPSEARVERSAGGTAGSSAEAQKTQEAINNKLRCEALYSKICGSFYRCVSENFYVFPCDSEDEACPISSSVEDRDDLCSVAMDAYTCGAPWPQACLQIMPSNSKYWYPKGEDTSKNWNDVCEKGEAAYLACALRLNINFDYGEVSSRCSGNLAFYGPAYECVINQTKNSSLSTAECQSALKECKLK